eukprot:jgi/Botrbrau1/13141/Bobra.0187s0091.1
MLPPQVSFPPQVPNCILQSIIHHLKHCQFRHRYLFRHRVPNASCNPSHINQSTVNSATGSRHRYLICYRCLLQLAIHHISS